MKPTAVLLLVTGIILYIFNFHAMVAISFFLAIISNRSADFYSIQIILGIAAIIAQIIVLVFATSGLIATIKMKKISQNGLLYTLSIFISGLFLLYTTYISFVYSSGIA